MRRSCARLANRVLSKVVVVLLLALASRSVGATTLLINQVNPYVYYGYGLPAWTDMSGRLNSAFGAANITVSSSPLDDLPTLLTYDRLWITPRDPEHPHGSALSAVEQANLSAFIATGRRVVLIGENGSWSAWDNSILAPVGGAFAGSTLSQTLTPVYAHPLTLGVAQLSINAEGLADGGIPLFNENVVTLWGDDQSVLSLLSVDAIDDDATSGSGHYDPISDYFFKYNLANWLVTPEPSTSLLVIAGLLGFAMRRARY